MPENDYFASSSLATVIAAIAAVAADANGPGVDISSYRGKAMFVASIAKTAGTNPTMDIKFQSAPDVNVVQSVAYSGSGNGTLTEVEAGAEPVHEDITITFSSATDFAVVGATSGALGSGTVGTKFTSPQINFLATAGATAFVNTDAFTVHTHTRTWSDITGAAYTQVTTTNSMQRLAINTDAAGRWIRPVYDIGGTDGPSYLIGITAYGMK